MFRRPLIWSGLQEENGCHSYGDDTVDGHRDDGFLNNRTFGVVHVQHAAHGDDVVDADHVAHCAADGLQGEDKGNGQAGIKRDLLLNRAEGQVGYTEEQRNN